MSLRHILTIRVALRWLYEWWLYGSSGVAADRWLSVMDAPHYVLRGRGRGGWRPRHSLNDTLINEVDIYGLIVERARRSSTIDTEPFKTHLNTIYL